MTDIDLKVDDQAARIEKIDQKISNNYDWVLIAHRLNFSTQDIKAWMSQVDPFLCMLQEWFIANKTFDAINGLLNVLKELNLSDCVQIIEDNLKKVELENADLLNDKDIDDRIVKSPAQVFISFEWSSKKKAQLLRDKLSERLNIDYKLSKEINRYKRH